MKNLAKRKSGDVFIFCTTRAKSGEVVWIFPLIEKERNFKSCFIRHVKEDKKIIPQIIWKTHCTAYNKISLHIKVAVGDHLWAKHTTVRGMLVLGGVIVIKRKKKNQDNGMPWKILGSNIVLDAHTLFESHQPLQSNCHSQLEPFYQYALKKGVMNKPEKSGSLSAGAKSHNSKISDDFKPHLL